MKRHSLFALFAGLFMNHWRRLANALRWPGCSSISWLTPGAWLVAVCLMVRLIQPGNALGEGLSLSVSNALGGVVLSWTSHSVTRNAPFLHPEFQVQGSSELTTWTNAGALIPGGALGASNIFRSVPISSGSAAGFYRVTYRLNLPGANLAGLDFTGADLRNADLSNANLGGANFTGADLSGANLSGVTLTGAILEGANLNGVNLNGLDLTGLDLSRTLGTPQLTQVTADPAGHAAQWVPHLAYNGGTGDLVSNDPFVPGTVSTRNAMLMLKTNATVGQLNALLAAHGASIVASSPGDVTLPNAVLMARFSTASASELYALTEVLNNDPIIEAAAPDVLLGLQVVPSDTGAEPDWAWDLAGTNSGGNWGLEFARVPQMWNVYGALQNKGAARVPTCIIDDHFANHTDLAIPSVISRPPSLADVLQPSDHGNHVAGIVGATYNNRFGIDGVNPLASLVGYEFRTRSTYGLAEDVRNSLRAFPNTRIINMSLGYNWYTWTNATRTNFTSAFTPDQLDFIESIALKYGLLMRAVAFANSSVLIVCAAGNDGKLIEARLNSPMCTAAIDYGAPNILVVEAHDPFGNSCSFSNLGGHVAAPGTNILSATAAGGFTYMNGTSMASPFAAGVAGFLLAVDPTFDPPTLISLLRKGGRNVDAFYSLMEIDALPGRVGVQDRAVLKMLLDIDDRSLDGSRRVEVEEATLGADRAFEVVDGIDFDGNNLVPGDGVIDMSDFRRWRDWLLFGEGNHALNGSDTHLKLDANANGLVHPFDEMMIFPRGDFNGDGKLDQGSHRGVGGWFEGFLFTDLGVLMSSDLWEDPCFTNVFGLANLIDSADFTVSVTNFYYKHTDIDADAKVAAYDAAARTALPDGGVCLSRDSFLHVLSVPIGKRCYIASAPIELGGGTNVQMRSIGEMTVPSSQRGADFAVDLTLWEMTTVADTLNPALRVIISDPNTNQADAYLGADGTGLGGATTTVGARGWANDAATMYAIANAGQLPVPPTNVNEVTTFASAVRWERSFIKNESQSDPRFMLKPMKLSLSGSGPGTNELRAFAEIVVEMRAYDMSPAWQPVFLYHAAIVGNEGVNGAPSTFRIEFQEGDLPPQTLDKNGNFGAEYRQVRHKDQIDLDGIPNGHSFELRFRMNTSVVGPEGEGAALARLGDPLEYGSGFRMEYGDFGELPRIKKVSPAAPANGSSGFQAAAQTGAWIEYRSLTNFYYRLYQGTDADTAGLPIAMKLGVGGDDSMLDPNPLLASPTPEDYTLENQPIDQPLDFDGDGIDDVYELLRPSILNALNAADSFQDPDDDGRSNLLEYQEGTDPLVPDAPNNPVLQFPGMVIPSYPGGELIDLNNDGLRDAAGPALSVALGHLGGSFGVQTNSPLPGIRITSDTAYLKLDGDAFLDAVIVDSLTNRVFVFRGEGDGTFTPLANYPAISGPSQIVLCNLNGDSLTDVALFSANGRGADLHVSNGDGTLTRIATLTTNAFGSGRGLAMGDFNGDQRDDVVLGYAANAVVFLSTNGSYGLAQPYPVGSSPESIAIGDLNQDGRLDVVTANRSSDDLSVLLGASGGTFLPQVRYPVGDLPLGLRLADLNGDTFLDAVVSRVSTDYQTVFRGLGNGAFAAPYTVPTGDSLTGLLDWNGDGRLDLFSGLSSSGGLVNLGAGDGTFDTRLQIVPTNTPPTEVTAVDFNADGKLELVGLNTQLHSIDVWEHAAVAGTNRLLSSFVVGHWVTAYAAGDFNGDGLVDLAVATQTNSFNPRGSNQVVVLTNVGGFSFQDAGHHPLNGRPSLLVAGDFNGDGALDLAAHLGGGTLNGGSQIVALLGNGAGGFQVGNSTQVGDTVASMTPANADGDLRSELLVRGSRIVGSAFVSFLEVLAADDTSGWTNRQSLAVTNFLGSLNVVSANGDAFPDLVLAQTDTVTGERSLRMFPGGPSGLGAEQVLANPVEFSAFSRIADLNGDGLLDVVGGNSLFLAKPGGGFHPAQSIWIGIQGAQEVADFNDDGKPDLLSGLSILLQK